MSSTKQINNAPTAAETVKSQRQRLPRPCLLENLDGHAM